MGIYEWRQSIFANNFASYVSEGYNESLREEKTKLFAKLREQKSKIPDYIAKDSIRIVELGAGSGSNLEYLPEKCHLTVVDPNLFFEDKVRASAAKYSGITFEGYIGGYAEDMQEHFADASVDAVVVTAVFCSVKDIQRAYKEIQRILVPGGKYYYIEHILGEKGSWTHYLQKVVTATHLWQLVTCDCNIDRDIDHQITLAGFSSVEQRLFRVDTSMKFGWHHFFNSQIIALHVTGIAFK